MEWRGREEGRVDSGEVRKLGRSCQGFTSPTSVPAQQLLSSLQTPYPPRHQTGLPRRSHLSPTRSSGTMALCRLPSTTPAPHF